MSTETADAMASDGGRSPLSPWVRRFAALVPAGGPVLDLACGSGRNGRFFRRRGHPVVMLDRDLAAIADMAADGDVELLQADLEDGRPWPLGARRFAAVVATNYLHRPLLADLVRAVAPGGAFIYETFAQGNERFGRPRNPAFLLRREELLTVARPALRVVAFEDLVVGRPRPAVIQRIAARRPGGADDMYDVAPFDPGECDDRADSA